MPQQFLYWPEQEYRVSRRTLPCGETAEVFMAHRGYALFCVAQGACRLDLGTGALLADGGSLVLLGPDVPYKLEACGSTGAAVLVAEFSGM